MDNILIQKNKSYEEKREEIANYLKYELNTRAPCGSCNGIFLCLDELYLHFIKTHEQDILNKGKKIVDRGTATTNRRNQTALPSTSAECIERNTNQNVASNIVPNNSNAVNLVYRTPSGAIRVNIVDEDF